MELAKQRRQIAFQVVRASLWVSLFAASGFLLFFMLADPPAGADPHVRDVRLGANAVVLCGAASGLVLLARGLLVPTVAVFALILYAAPMISAIAAGFGVYSPGMAIWPVLILMFGLVWGTAAAVGVTTLLMASVVGLALAQLGGVLPGPTLAALDDPEIFASMRIFLLVAICWLTVSYARTYSAAFDAATRSQKELAANERELRAIIETEPECVKVLGLDGSLRQMNRAGLDMIEADSIDQVVGKSIFGIVAPPYREAFAALHERVERGESGVLEFEVVGLKGGHRWLETHAVPMRDDDDRVTALLGITRDITERKRSELALSNLQEMLRTAVGAARVFPWEWDIAADRLVWGVYPEVLLGPPHDAEAGYPDFRQLVHAQDLEAFLAAGRHSLASGAPYRCEFRIMATDGSVRWIHARGEVVRSADGRIERLIGASLDITERKLTEQRLIASEARASQIIENASNAILVVDEDGRILSTNGRADTLFGYAGSELVGQVVEVLVPESLRERHRDVRAAYARHPEPRAMGKGRDLLARRKDGGMFPVEISLAPMPVDKGMQVIVTVADITERRRLLEDLERHRDHLEEMVAERTADLVAAQAEAERLGRAKSEFLANMSHEIRTPLNAVLGLSRIGARDSAEKSREIFAGIEKSGEHLLGVINDILDFSRLDAGKLDTERRPFNLAGVIDTAVGFVDVEALHKGLAVEATTAADLPQWVTGDAQHLQQILVNLLSNAVKFTEHGEVRLRVASDGEDTWFKVIDTGIGMSEALMARLFQPFVQADSSTTRKFGGTGLGLAISRNLARLMGGEITVDSAPGAGCSFTLRLPLPRAEPDLPAHTAAQAASRRLAGLRLLAAEDVDLNRVVLEDLLIHEGAHVIFAEDGQQALDRLEEAGVSAFDAVLMDVQMPVMDGLEATRRLREMAPALPVIGLTAHAFAEQRDKCRAAGMVEHVTKPIDADLLVAAILRHARPWRPDAPSPLYREGRGAASPSPLTGEGRGEGADAVPPAPTSAAGAAREASLIDWAELLARYAGREAFVAKLAAIALNSQRNIPAELRAAAARQDLQAMASIAHGIKSVGGNLMAHGLQDLATRAEIAARRSEPGAASLASELADAVTALLDELSAREAAGRTT